jgi:hypothetical protein
MALACHSNTRAASVLMGSLKQAPSSRRGERWISPDGDEGLEFNLGHSGVSGWEEQDHWYVLKPRRWPSGKWDRDESIGDRGHLAPDEEVDLNSCFSPVPSRPWSSTTTGGRPVTRVSRSRWCHSFRATGITEYPKNGGMVENAAQITAHESTKTT